MASLDSMLAALLPNVRRAPAGASKLRAGRNIIRGATGRAYDFEAHTLDSAQEMSEVAAIYIYARNLSAAAAHERGLDATIEDYALGYIAETEDMGEAAAQHGRAQHFRGHDLDVVLLVRVDQSMIRKEIEEDLLALHRPVLNDLLGSNKRAERV